MRVTRGRNANAGLHAALREPGASGAHGRGVLRGLPGLRPAGLTSGRSFQTVPAPFPGGDCRRLLGGVSPVPAGVLLGGFAAEPGPSVTLPRLLFPFQNKEFVCRGHDYERLEAFQQRMLGEFPHAIAMQHANQPDETIFQADAQCIHRRRLAPWRREAARACRVAGPPAPCQRLRSSSLVLITLL